MSGCPDLELSGDIQMTGVGALLVTAGCRYLMQLRDDVDGVRMRGHWGVFGGAMDSGETPEQALLREIEEELCIMPHSFTWFTQFAYCLNQVGRKFHHKYFYEVPIDDTDIARMVQKEGAGMRLMSFDELMGEPLVVPWDAYAVMLHARRVPTFDLYDGYRRLGGPGLDT